MARIRRSSTSTSSRRPATCSIARCDDIFYFNKGRLYANYLLLRELGVDFENIIRERA